MKYTRVSYNLNWSVLGRDQEGGGGQNGGSWCWEQDN